MVSVVKNFEIHKELDRLATRRDVTEALVEKTWDSANTTPRGFYAIELSLYEKIDKQMKLLLFPGDNKVYEKVLNDRCFHLDLDEDNKDGTYYINRFGKYYCNFEEARRFTKSIGHFSIENSNPSIIVLSYKVYLITPCN